MTASPPAQRQATQRVGKRVRLPWAHSCASAALSLPSGIVAPIRDALRPSRRAGDPRALLRSASGHRRLRALRVAPQQLAVLLCAPAASGALDERLDARMVAANVCVVARSTAASTADCDSAGRCGAGTRSPG